MGSWPYADSTALQPLGIQTVSLVGGSIPQHFSFLFMWPPHIHSCKQNPNTIIPLIPTLSVLSSLLLSGRIFFLIKYSPSAGRKKSQMSFFMLKRHHLFFFTLCLVTLPARCTGHSSTRKREGQESALLVKRQTNVVKHLRILSLHVSWKKLLPCKMICSSLDGQFS